MWQHPVKLRALDAEDLALVSALVQDALVDPGALAFERGRSQFGGPLVRFLHEESQRPRIGPLRQSAAVITFGGVRAVRSHGLDRRARDALELLALVGDAEAGRIDLLFAGGGMIRLTVEDLDCRLQDIGEAWVTTLRPRHSETS